jgi:hypothetical protein
MHAAYDRTRTTTTISDKKKYGSCNLEAGHGTMPVSLRADAKRGIRDPWQMESRKKSPATAQPPTEWHREAAWKGVLYVLDWDSALERAKRATGAAAGASLFVSSRKHASRYVRTHRGSDVCVLDLRLRACVFEQNATQDAFDTPRCLSRC